MNEIHKTAKIDPNVVLGNYNKIGQNVEIVLNNENSVAFLGDNNIIYDNTRIIVNGRFKIGDWNVFHNNMLIMAEDHLAIGHNCWFGQNTILDGAGGLEIGNGVRVGMYSQIWTHVASGELIEGCNLYSKRKVIIEDDVWLVGSCVVSSGIILRKRSTALINSVLTKSTEPDKAYSGSPAKVMENVKFYNPITLDEKFNLIIGWLKEFVGKSNNYELVLRHDQVIVFDKKTLEEVTFYKWKKNINELGKSAFCIQDKTYNKTNIKLEREVYKFLYGNKARFLNIQ